MKLLLPLLGVLLLLSASCRKKIEDIAITKRDTVKILVDSSNYKRLIYIGNMNYTYGSYNHPKTIDSNYETTIVVTLNYKDYSIQFSGASPLTGFYAIDNSNQYGGNKFYLTGDSLYAHYHYDNSNGTHPPSIVEEYNFSGKN